MASYGRGVPPYRPGRFPGDERADHMWITLRRTAILSLTTAVVALTGAGISAAAADLGPPTGTAEVTAAPTGPGPALLTGVRVGRHADYDRTVFDFTGGTPGYRVRSEPLYTEARGDLVHPQGAATPSIHLNPPYAHKPPTGARTADPS